MPAIASDYRKILEAAVSIAAALIVVSSMKVSAQAQTNHMLVIPASDGYGFDECMSQGTKTCGQVIADAYCEAHGMSASLSYGRAEDITASVPTAADAKPAIKVEPGSYVVNCKD